MKKVLPAKYDRYSFLCSVVSFSEISLNSLSVIMGIQNRYTKVKPVFEELLQKIEEKIHQKKYLTTDIKSVINIAFF